VRCGEVLRVTCVSRETTGKKEDGEGGRGNGEVEEEEKEGEKEEEK